VNTDLFFEQMCFRLLGGHITGGGSAARNPWTQLHVLSRHVIVDGTLSTYFLLRSGVSPSFKGDEAVRVRATCTYSMHVHFS
jgi:hypothetical protein